MKHCFASFSLKGHPISGADPSIHWITVNGISYVEKVGKYQVCKHGSVWRWWRLSVFCYPGFQNPFWEKRLQETSCKLMSLKHKYFGCFHLVSLLVISELMKEVALAFTTGTGDLGGANPSNVNVFLSFWPSWSHGFTVIASGYKVT